MIDPLDKQTQPLPLDQKRGRGRPATGQALSNAERQRRYREAQKAQRNENMHKEVAEELRAELAKALERIEAAEAKVRAEFELGEKARKRVRELEAQLAQRNEIESKTAERWVVQMKTTAKGRWKTLTPKDNEWPSERKAEESLENMPLTNSRTWYRVLKI